MKKETILVDLHHTLLNEDKTPNKNLVNLINRLTGYKVVIFTAKILRPEDLLQECKSTGLLSYEAICPNEGSLGDDVQLKTYMLQDVKQTAKIKFLIDNNKEVCKAFRKLGIDTLKFKKGE